MTSAVLGSSHHADVGSSSSWRSSDPRERAPDVVAGERPEIVVEDVAHHAVLPRIPRGAAEAAPVAGAVPGRDPARDRGAVVGRRGGLLEQRHDVARGERGVVVLDPAHLLDGQAIGAVQVDLLVDPFGAKARVPFLGHEVRVVRVDRRVVGGHDQAVLRIELPGQVVERDPAGPLAAAVIATDRAIAAVVGVRADRHVAGELVADVAVDVGIDEVLRRGAVEREARPEVLEVRRGIEAEDRLERPVGLDGRRPADRHRRGIRQPLVDVVEDRPVDRRADLEVERFLAGHLDLLVADLERGRHPVVEVGVRVRRVDGLDDEILDVGVDVGGAPRDAGVVAEDDAGHARERDAGDVVRAVGRDGPAMEAVDEPDRRHRDAEVRVVGEQGAAGQRHPRADDPVVRADAVVRGEAVGVIEPGGPEEPLAETGDRAPGGRLGRADRSGSWRPAVAWRRRPWPQPRSRPAPPDPGRPVGVITGHPRGRPGTARRSAPGPRGPRPRGSGRPPNRSCLRGSRPGPCPTPRCRGPSTVRA